MVFALGTEPLGTSPLASGELAPLPGEMTGSVYSYVNVGALTTTKPENSQSTYVNVGAFTPVKTENSQSTYVNVLRRPLPRKEDYRGVVMLDNPLAYWELEEHTQNARDADNFLKPDNASSLGSTNKGVAWVNAVGTMGIVTSQAYAPLNALAVAVIDNGTTDGALEVTFGIAANDAALVFRYIDTNNYWYLLADGVLHEVVAGTSNQRYNPSQAYGTGQRMTLEFQGAAIRYYRDDLLVGNFTAAAAPSASATWVGLRAGTNVPRFTDFRAATITGTMPTSFKSTVGDAVLTTQGTFASARRGLLTEPDSFSHYFNNAGHLRWDACPTISAPWTVEAIVRFPAGGGNGLWGSRGPSDGSYDGVMAEGALHADVGTGSSWLVTNADVSISIAANVLHHIAFVCRTNAWEWWLDGYKVGSGSLGGIGRLCDSTHLLCFGGKGNGETRWTGSIDEIAIYGRALEESSFRLRNDRELAASVAANARSHWGVPIR